MKYLLILSLLFLTSCADEQTADKFRSIKYGDKFTVEDDFYGKIECVATEKYIVVPKICGFCSYSDVSKKMCFYIEDIENAKLEPK